MDSSPNKKNGFQKGKVSNPKGRPKGALNKHRRKFLEIQKMAAGRAKEAFNILWESLEAKESWALQIFFKELYTVPKTSGEEYVKVAIPEMINKEGVQVFLARFIESLQEFEGYTKNEILSVIKTLNSVKLTEHLETQSKNLLSYLDDKEAAIVHQIFSKVRERILSERDE